MTERQRLFGMFLICVVSAAIVLTASCTVKKPEIRYEQTGPVLIGNVDWYYRTFVVVFPNGVNRLMSPLCDGAQTAQVWQGAKMDIKFHWTNPTEYYGCYVLDEVREVK